MCHAFGDLAGIQTHMRHEGSSSATCYGHRSYRRYRIVVSPTQLRIVISVGGEEGASHGTSSVANSIRALWRAITVITQPGVVCRLLA